jgi:hypothetical protein
MRLSLAVGALDERDFRLLFFGRAVSAAGDQMAPLALAFAVLEATRSATDLGFVFAAREVASVAVLLAAGVWADRVRRERLMIASNLARVAAQGATGLLLVAGSAHLWQLLLLQAIAGGADGAFQPARNAITPQVVSPARLQQANALLQMVGSVIGVVGPLAAAGIVAAGSPGVALLADAATFVLSAAFLSALHTTPPERTGSGFFSDLRGGWAEFRSYEWLWKAVAFVCVSNMMGAAYFVFGPGIAKHDLGGASAWGIILAGNAAGWVVGGIISTRYQPSRPMLASSLCAMLWPIQTPLLALHPNVWIIAVGAAVGGAGLAMSITFWFTTLQSKIPAASLARVSSYDDFGGFVFNPLGFAIAGPIGNLIGVTATVIGAAVISTTAYLLAIGTRSIRDLRLEP